MKKSAAEGSAINEGSAHGLRPRRSGQPPLVIGHRGARGEMPENTLAGLEHAYASGIRTIEIDVQTAADGVPVVWHDSVLEPDKVRGGDGQWVTTPGPRVAELTAADLGNYRVGSLMGSGPTRQRFPDQAICETAHISTLSAVCGWMSDRADVFVNVEIKSFHHSAEARDLVTALARSVVLVLQSHGLMDRVLITSFDWRVLEQVRRIAPTVQIGCLSQLPGLPEDIEQNIYAGSVWMNGAQAPDTDLRLPHIVKDQGGTVWAPYFRDLIQEDVALAHDLGVLVIVWTVNERADIATVSDMGVDAIITDYPTRARAWLDHLSGSSTPVSILAQGG